MSWIDGVEAGTPIDALLGLRPGLLARYKAFYSALWEDDLLPRRLLELCRLRIAEIHGCAQQRTVRDAAADWAKPNSAPRPSSHSWSHLPSST